MMGVIRDSVPPHRTIWWRFSSLTARLSKTAHAPPRTSGFAICLSGTEATRGTAPATVLQLRGQIPQDINYGAQHRGTCVPVHLKDFQDQLNTAVIHNLRLVLHLGKCETLKSTEDMGADGEVGDMLLNASL